MGSIKIRIKTYYVTGDHHRSRGVLGKEVFSNMAEARRAFEKQIARLKANGYKLMAQEPDRAMLWSEKQKIRAYIAPLLIR